MNVYIKQGDHGPIIFDLKDESSPLDLTNADEVKFCLERDDLYLESVGSIVGDPAEGQVEVTLDNGQTDVPGVYQGEVVVSYTDKPSERVPNYGYLKVIIGRKVDED